MPIYDVEGREREYDDTVDTYNPNVQSTIGDPPPKPGDKRLGANGVWETWDGSTWVPDTVAPPTITPPPTTGGDTNQPKPYGPGVYMDRNSPPPFAAPPGLKWKFDEANGWYPGSDYVGKTSGDDTPTTPPGAFDYGRDPNSLPFSPYQSMAPFSFSQGPLTFEPFSYKDFEQSSWEDAEKEPGFAESQSRLAKMIQNTAAYRGILRSGATIGDLGTYLDQNKGQNFQQFDARRYRDYGANRENAFGAWAANTGAKADTWSRNLGAEQFGYGQAATENDRGNNFRFNTEKANMDDLLSRWTTLVNSATSLARPV